MGEGRTAFFSDRGLTLGIIIFLAVVAMLLVSDVLHRPGRRPETRILAEVTSLDGAIKAFKERYGMAPPSDFSDMTPKGPVGIFLAQAFPQCDVPTELAWISKNGGSLSPAQALVFWLQGFSSDPRHPLSQLKTNLAMPLFPFDLSRLVSSSATYPALNQRFAAYVPRDGSDAPYVYFASQNYKSQAAYMGAQGGTGICKPYPLDTGGYVNPESFQIISAGLDGDYGSGNGSYPSGRGYNDHDHDNLTNFPSGMNLGDSIPDHQ